MVSRSVSSAIRWMVLSGMVLAVCGRPAEAQQRQPTASSEWSRLPRMELERQYAGPLQDTIVQRWRDPADGTICYIYLPITAEHSQPTASGFVQYGANAIGSVSCFAGPVAPAAKMTAPSRPQATVPGNPAAK
jgi:hypothetical protein